ncbi:MAG TPA: hypothetical protein DCZ71_04035 [Ruminococcus sp.]|nr:hypothetical protein [Ruminococcus sp.]
MRKNVYFFIIIAASLLLGAVFTSAIQGASGLYWLAYSIHFGLPANTYIDLSVLTFTIGFTVDISVMQIIMLIIGFIVYFNTVKKVTEGK